MAAWGEREEGPAKQAGARKREHWYSQEKGGKGFDAHVSGSQWEESPKTYGAIRKAANRAIKYYTGHSERKPSNGPLTMHHHALQQHVHTPHPCLRQPDPQLLSPLQPPAHSILCCNQCVVAKQLQGEEQLPAGRGDLRGGGGGGEELEACTAGQCVYVCVSATLRVCLCTCAAVLFI